MTSTSDSASTTAAISANASGSSTSSWSRRTTNSPVAAVSALLVAREMPPFCSRAMTRIRGSPAAISFIAAVNSGSPEPSSQRQSSQFV